MDITWLYIEHYRTTYYSGLDPRHTNHRSTKFAKLVLWCKIARLFLPLRSYIWRYTSPLPPQISKDSSMVGNLFLNRVRTKALVILPFFGSSMILRILLRLPCQAAQTLHVVTRFAYGSSFAVAAILWWWWVCWWMGAWKRNINMVKRPRPSRILLLCVWVWFPLAQAVRKTQRQEGQGTGLKWIAGIYKCLRTSISYYILYTMWCVLNCVSKVKLQWVSPRYWDDTWVQLPLVRRQPKFLSKDPWFGLTSSTMFPPQRCPQLAPQRDDAAASDLIGLFVDHRAWA